MTKEGQGYDKQKREQDRVVTLKVTCSLDPDFDLEGEDFYVTCPEIHAEIETEVAPPHAEVKVLKTKVTLPIPELEKHFFTKSPRCVAYARASEKIVEIPKHIDAKVSQMQMNPWGSLKLLLGDEETELFYQVTISSKLTQVAGASSNEVLADMSFAVICQLGGVGSAKLTPDGKPLENPEPGSLIAQ